MTLEVDGTSFAINSDFRACLAVLAAFTDTELTNQDKLTVALTILYGEENLPQLGNYRDAYEKAMWFLNCGRAFSEKEQDEQLIFSGIAATIGWDVRAEGDGVEGRVVPAGVWGGVKLWLGAKLVCNLLLRIFDPFLQYLPELREPRHMPDHLEVDAFAFAGFVCVADDEAGVVCQAVDIMGVIC